MSIFVKLSEADLHLSSYLTAFFLIFLTSVFWFFKVRGGTLLSTRARRSLFISEIEELSADVKRIRLTFPRSGMKLGLPVGKHLKIFAGPNPASRAVVKGKWNGREDEEAFRKEIDRAYTPVTGDEVRGFVDLVVKMYRPGEVKMPDGKIMKWDDGGKMSGCFLDEKKVGDTVEISGPFGLVEYKGRGKWKLPGVKGTVMFG